MFENMFDQLRFTVGSWKLPNLNYWKIGIYLFLFSNCWAKAMPPPLPFENRPFKLWKFLSGFQIKIHTIFITVPFQVRSNTDKNIGKMLTTNVLNDNYDYVVDIFSFITITSKC